MPDPLVRYARECASVRLGGDQPDAWARSERAALHAERAVGATQRPRGDMIVAAAWLHAVGESTGLRSTGFAPVDGAVYLLSEGWPDPVVSLVAHQAQSRMLAPAFRACEQLALFERIQGWPSDITDFAVVMALGDGPNPDPDQCLRESTLRIPAKLGISARDRGERERRLRRAIDRVQSSLIAAPA